MLVGYLERQHDLAVANAEQQSAVSLTTLSVDDVDNKDDGDNSYQPSQSG